MSAEIARNLNRLRGNRRWSGRAWDRVSGMKQLPTESTMWRAFCVEDSQIDGVFFVAVRTTGGFCRPTCPAKPPPPKNEEFFATAAAAGRRGYRAGKLCLPTEGGE